MRPILGRQPSWRKRLKKKTSSLAAKGNDGRNYTVDVWTNFQNHLGKNLPGSDEYLLSNGDELIDVFGKDDQWQIASTGVVITKVQENS